MDERVPDVHVRHPMIIEFSLLDSWLGCWLPMLVEKKKDETKCRTRVGRFEFFFLSFLILSRLGCTKVPNVVM